MIRIVRTEEGLYVDPSGKLPGRGAYLHNLKSCWEIGIKTTLSRSLKTQLNQDDIERLTAYMDTLPDEEQIEPNGDS